MMAKFKAIIVGGGPVGMVVAHALTLAGIDFILVEKRDHVSTWTGAGLTMWPHGERILDQLGLLETLSPLAMDVTRMETVLENGRPAGWYSPGGVKAFGYSLAAYERGAFLEALYRKLPDAEKKIKTSKRVSDITTQKDGVVVRFDDGTSEEGSILIGVDGVWSTVRQCIAKAAPPGAVEDSFWKAQYLCAYGRGKVLAGLPKNTMLDRHDNGWACNIGNHNDEQAIWLVYKRIPETQEKKTYSEQDEEEFWRDILDEKVYKDLTFRQLWEGRIATGLTRLNQGMAKAWHWDRVVMVGDANHKPTPNIGAGVVVGAEAAVVLTNKLHALLQTDPDPDTEALTAAFKAYQAEQQERAGIFLYIGNSEMKKLTYDTWSDWFLSRYVDPMIRPLLQWIFMKPMVLESPILDFVPFEHEKSGDSPWKYGKQQPPPLTWYQTITRGIGSIFGLGDKTKSD
ncbi:FAD/NAD(P)-binding domain-containing protein [Thozetella sp. PMI_491]|nr:FAD/NAD(P)-binding domain-containing protein [Thozetella sp. PMI_491]